MNLDKSQFLLTDLLRNGAVTLQLQSSKRDGVLDELVRLIPELREIPQAQSTLLRALRDREELHSTGLGNGVAAPHARTPVAGAVRRAVVVFGRHVTGIPYGAPDGQPVKLFFLVIAPTVQEHLGLLARLSRLVSKPALRDQLLQARRVEEVLQIVRAAEASI